MKTPEPGSRAAAIANAKVRARAEERPIFVLQYLDGEQTYTACVSPGMRSARTRLHGRVERRGSKMFWVPLTIMDLDDVVAYLETAGQHEIAAEVERRRGDRA